MSLTPQLQPTDFAKLETVRDRAEREKQLKENWVFRHEEPQGTRYTKGLHPMATKRSWQSLDAVLRSDRNASAALPYKQLRRSRIFAALAAVSGMLFIAGSAATAREGFDFKKASGGNMVMLGGALAALAFAITSGVFYRRAQTGYERAVNIYNDSLGLRLGLLTPSGDYVPPEGAAVDEEGFILTEDKESRVEGPAQMPALGQPAPAPAPPAPAPTPTPQPPAAPPSTTVAPQTASVPSSVPSSAPSSAPSSVLEPPEPPGAVRRRKIPAPWPTLTLLPSR
jgi:hypothetical protein